MRWLTNVRIAFGMEDLHSRMARIANECGVRVISHDEDSYLLETECQGHRLKMFLQLGGDGRVYVAVLSNIEFPEGRLPEAACRALARRNERLSRCGYSTHNGLGSSRFVVRAWIPLSRLTVQTFAAAHDDMVPHAAILDDMLERYGFAH